MKRIPIGGYAILALALGVAVGRASAQTITEFSIPTPDSVPRGITAGPDGNLWFTESKGNKIGRISPSGVIHEFLIPTPDADPRGITAGPDAALWFREARNGQVGRITRAGLITEFPISHPSQDSFEIAAGADEALWFSYSSLSAGEIGRITTTGVVTLFHTPGFVLGIAAGPDGNTWFTESGFPTLISRINPDGVITVVRGFYGSPGRPSHSPRRIVAGPDGNLWFTEGRGLGRITTKGSTTFFPSSPAPGDIVAGADGNLWFTEPGGNRIGRITTEGTITKFEIPTVGSSPDSIAAGPDGALWFTESSTNKIGRITTAGIGACVADPYSLCLSGNRFRATATYRNPGAGGTARARSLSDSSGFFTFDNPDSVEVAVKVLNACSFDPFIWVFAAGLTDQETMLTVTDTQTGEVRTYFSPLGTKFVTITDTAAFSACP